LAGWGWRCAWGVREDTKTNAPINYHQHMSW
jgi:hypothetical protein